MTAIHPSAVDPDTDSAGDGYHPTESHEENDIRVEYYPNSGRETDIFKIDDYLRSVPDVDAVVEPEPWAPFRTREDFEFAEIVLEAGMTRSQINALIKLFHRCIKKGDGGFTISNHKDLANTFDIAANRLAKV